MAIFAIVVVMSAAFFPIERTLELRTDIVVGPKTAIMLHVDRAELQRQLRHHAPPSSPPPSSMNDTAPSFSMPDIGFTLTTPLHDYLFAHPDLHDLLALLNTIGVVAMYPYAIFREKSVLDGRPGLVVCGMLMFMLRLVVGCATQLPMHPEYLPSRFDFPDAMYGERVPFQVCRLATERSLARVRCRLSDPADSLGPPQYFYSGHCALVALATAAATELGHTRLARFTIWFNIAQVRASTSARPSADG